METTVTLEGWSAFLSDIELELLPVVNKKRKELGKLELPLILPSELAQILLNIGAQYMIGFIQAKLMEEDESNGTRT